MALAPGKSCLTVELWLQNGKKDANTPSLYRKKNGNIVSSMPDRVGMYVKVIVYVFIEIIGPGKEHCRLSAKSARSG